MVDEPFLAIYKGSLFSAESAGLEQHINDDTIQDVDLSKEIQLEAIAEEVQKSWRLKEVRAEAIMQKAVARSERPWLVLLSSLFLATVVLLALVLYQLSNNQIPGSWVTFIASNFLIQTLN